MLPLRVVRIDFGEAPAYGETLFVNRQITDTLNGAGLNTSPLEVARLR
jgi:hypothetical protein